MSHIQPSILSDRIEALYKGEEIVIWNEVTVTQYHYVTPTRIEQEHEISVGDSIGNDSPDYITPNLSDDLEYIHVYPNAEVVDPRDDEVVLL